MAPLGLSTSTSNSLTASTTDSSPSTGSTPSSCTFNSPYSCTTASTFTCNSVSSSNKTSSKHRCAAGSLGHCGSGTRSHCQLKTPACSPPTNKYVLNIGGRSNKCIFQGSLRGVKRKSLATALTSSKSGSHHLDWTSAWDAEMPPDLLAKCRPLHCQLCDVQVCPQIRCPQTKKMARCDIFKLLLYATIRQLLLCKPRCTTRERLMTSTSGAISPPSTS